MTNQSTSPSINGTPYVKRFSFTPFPTLPPFSPGVSLPCTILIIFQYQRDNGRRHPRGRGPVAIDDTLPETPTSLPGSTTNPASSPLTMRSGPSGIDTSLHAMQYPERRERQPSPEAGANVNVTGGNDRACAVVGGGSGGKAFVTQK